MRQSEDRQVLPPPPAAKPPSAGTFPEAASSRTPPHGASLRQQAAVIAVALGSIALVTNEFLPVALLTSIRTSLHVSEGTAATMVTAPAVTAAVSAPVLAVAVGRLDRRTVLVTMTALFTASDALAALAANFAVMLVARLLLGVAVGGFWAIGVGIGDRLVPPARAAWATAVILSGVSIASVFGVPAAALLGGHLGWRAAFWATGALALLAMVLIAALLPRVCVDSPVTFARLAEVLRAPNARLGLLTEVGLVSGQFAAYTFITPLLAHHDHAGSGYVSAMLLLFGIAGIVGNFAVVRPMEVRPRASVLVMSAALAAAAAAMALAGGSKTAAVIILIVWGAAYGALPVALQRWIYTTDGRDLSAGVALFPATYQASTALGSLLGGLVVTLGGDSAAMLTGAAFAALTFIAFSVFARPVRRPSAS
jgi:predicted MFS family arabinose efflux permease